MDESRVLWEWQYEDTDFRVWDSGHIQWCNPAVSGDDGWYDEVGPIQAGPELSRLVVSVAAKDGEIERLREFHSRLVSVAFDPGYNEETRWRMTKEELEKWIDQ